MRPSGLGLALALAAGAAQAGDYKPVTFKAAVAYVGPALHASPTLGDLDAAGPLDGALDAWFPLGHAFAAVALTARALPRPSPMSCCGR